MSSLASYLIARPLVKAMRRLRGPAAACVGEAGLRVPATFLAWPPVRTVTDFRSLSTKISWLVPRRAVREILIVSELGSARAHDIPAPIRVLNSPLELGPILRDAPVILVWKLVDSRIGRILPGLRSAYAIDPAGPGSVELLEWRQLYETFGAPLYEPEMRAESARNFRTCLARLQSAAEDVNVLGTGPTMNQAFGHDLSRSTNIICNAAVMSAAFLRHTRPAIVGFLDPIYFSPALSAQTFIAAVRRCIEEYDSFVVTREGYRHFLLKQNYKSIESRVIGISPEAAPSHPVNDRLVSYSTNNVVTGLLLPMALSMRPRRIRVWGCDGKDTGGSRPWSYANGPAAPGDEEAAHPSYMNRLKMMKQSRYEYEKHCRCLEVYSRYIEAQGVELVAATPSFIPALAARQVRGTSDVATSAGSVR